MNNKIYWSMLSYKTSISAIKWTLEHLIGLLCQSNKHFVILEEKEEIQISVYLKKIHFLLLYWMFLLRSLSAIYYYYLLNLFSKRRCDNVIKETGVFQTYSIAFSRFSNFHREFSNFPIAFCNVFSKINLINNFLLIFPK
jgi:hypothetical protein